MNVHLSEVNTRNTPPPGDILCTYPLRGSL